MAYIKIEQYFLSSSFIEIRFVINVIKRVLSKNVLTN